MADDDDQSEGDQNQVLKWVLEVDKHIEKSSMEILKLGLRTDLTRAEMEREKSPSDLYHKLKRKYSNEDTQIHLCPGETRPQTTWTQSCEKIRHVWYKEAKAVQSS